MVYDLCVYYMTGTPEGSTESGFMEKPGIEPATPGLQGIALIHYTTGASRAREELVPVRHGFHTCSQISCSNQNIRIPYINKYSHPKQGRSQNAENVTSKRDYSIKQ